MNCRLCEKNKRIKGRTICYCCRYRIEKERDPIRLSYNRLKGHAKERNKEFSITLEYFTAFCIETNYISKKGITKTSYHIDRKDETKGYVEGNIQLLKNIENVRKYIEFISIDENGKKVFKTKKSILNNNNQDEDCPF